MCCGFGSVILLFVIVNTRSDQPHSSDISTTPPRESRSTILTAAQHRTEKERTRFGLIQAERENKQIRDEIVTIEAQLGIAAERRDFMIARIQSISNQFEGRESNPNDAQSNIAQLQEELKVLENEIVKLQAGIQATKERQNASEIRLSAGDGYRHYLTGLTLSGRRTLILLDCSASMLSDHIVDILRRRNMNKPSRQVAPKWRQAVAAADWLLSQLPVDSRFQLYGFNETTFPMLEQSAGEWLDVSNTKTLTDVSEALHDLAPEKGTSLYKALKLISTINPPPDNVVLMTDGLPTVGSGPSLLRKVSARRRFGLFKNAVRLIPDAVSVNVILYQMEGDPEAASAYWRLARVTKGSFFCPSRDWP